MVDTIQNAVSSPANDRFGAVGAVLDAAQPRRPLARAQRPYPPEQLQPVDLHVGSRIRERREAMELTQSELATRIGATGQQVHRYESGVDRVGAGRIWELGQVLGCRVSYFFDGLDAESAMAGSVADVAAKQAESRSHCETAQSEATEVVRLYHCIGDSVVQRRIMELARALASKGRNRSAATRPI